MPEEKIAVILVIQTSNPIFWETSEGLADALGDQISHVETYRTINFGPRKGPVKIEEGEWKNKEEPHEITLGIDEEE